MSEKNLLDAKRILLVDDEPDILETLEDLLPMARLKTAATFDAAKALLESEPFDIAVLDIMGVDGYELLKGGDPGLCGALPPGSDLPG